MRRTIPMLLLFAALVGCGSRPKLTAVTGKVVHKGQGVTAGSLYFHSARGNAWQGEKPSSLLATDGGFAMRTYPHGQGVPPGTYKVTLAPEVAKRLGAPVYADHNKTPWSVEVPAGGVANKVFEVR